MGHNAHAVGENQPHGDFFNRLHDIAMNINVQLGIPIDRKR